MAQASRWCPPARPAVPAIVATWSLLYEKIRGGQEEENQILSGKGGEVVTEVLQVNAI